MAAVKTSWGTVAYLLVLALQIPMWLCAGSLWGVLMIALAGFHPINGFGGPESSRLAQFVMLDGSVRTFDPAKLANLKSKVPE